MALVTMLISGIHAICFVLVKESQESGLSLRRLRVWRRFQRNWNGLFETIRLFKRRVRILRLVNGE